MNTTEETNNSQPQKLWDKAWNASKAEEIKNLSPEAKETLIAHYEQQLILLRQSTPQTTYEDVLKRVSEGFPFASESFNFKTEHAKDFANAFAKKVQICEYLNSRRVGYETMYMVDFDGATMGYPADKLTDTPMLYNRQDAPELIRLMADDWEKSFMGGRL